MPVQLFLFGLADIRASQKGAPKLRYGDFARTVRAIDRVLAVTWRRLHRCRGCSLISAITDEKRKHLMITVPELAAEALGSFLSEDMKRRFGASHARLTELIPSVARLAIECIGNSDALYHNVEHTMLVTLVGHDIMKGRALLAPNTTG